MLKTNAESDARDEITIRVAWNVRDALHAERWSARRAAAELGLTPMYVSRRLTGATEMSAADLAEFARLARVRVQDFYRDRDDDQRPRGGGPGAGRISRIFGEVPPAGFEPAAFCSEGGQLIEVDFGGPRELEVA